MKNRATLLTVLLFALCVHLGYAQSRTISGVVKEASSGQAIPGVAVLEKGTRNGTATNLDGEFQITLTGTGNVLVFQAIGKESKEVTVGTEDFISVQLMDSQEQLDEIVVTALGISRQKEAVGYAVQEIDGEEVSKAREVNIANSLSGRLAGVQVSSATGSMGGSSRILIRGAASIDNNSNQPLFVVDGVPMDNSNFTSADQERGAGGYDYGNAIQDINPEDIENISVLKGAAAAALYGSRGANGVILVTTKKGKAALRGKGIGVSYKFGMTMDNVYILPDYQNTYGGGFGFDTLWYSSDPGAFGNRGAGEYQGTNPNTGLTDSYDLLAQYRVDESWGPKLDGQQVRHWWSWTEGHPDYGQTGAWSPQPDNIENFFETGYTLNNSVALYNATETNSFRLSYSNLTQNGVFPNSELKRNNFSFNGATDFTDKFSGRIGVNYVKTNAIGRPGTGYDGNNVMQQFNQWGQRQVDMDKMEDYIFEGQQRSWNRRSYTNPVPQYTDNPYWTMYENYQNDDRDRVFGNINLAYKITDKLTIDATAMTDFYTDTREERIAIGSQAVPQYVLGERFVMENNYETKLTYTTRFSDDFGLVGLLGGNIRDNFYKRNINTTANGLNAPNYYNLDNSVSPYITDQFGSQRRVNSIFASASFDYKTMVYLDVTLRRDAVSTLPEANRSFYYPSVSGSWVFSEMGGLRTSAPWLTFGKLRLAWAQVGNDTEPYRFRDYYIVEQSFNGNANVSLPNVRNNPNLEAETTNQIEAGIELGLFKNRWRTDFTVYKSNSYNQILNLPVSASTGVSYLVVNAGDMENRGFELQSSFDIFRAEERGDFSWNIGLNLARNINVINELYRDDEGNEVKNYLLQQAPFAVQLRAVEGESYGSIFGYAYERDANGNKLVDAAGRYIRSAQQQTIGNVLPDFTGGVTNQFSFKGFSLSALVDFQIGGDVFSTTNMWAKYSGMTQETVDNNIREEGIVVEGVYAEGTTINGVDVSGQQNTSVLDAQSHFFYNGGYVVGEADVYDAGYVYLREVTLSYTLPTSFSDRLKVNNLTVGLFGRNLWLIHRNIPHLDPTALANSATNIQGLEGAALPSIRSLGFNVSFNF